MPPASRAFGLSFRGHEVCRTETKEAAGWPVWDPPAWLGLHLGISRHHRRHSSSARHFICCYIIFNTFVLYDEDILYAYILLFYDSDCVEIACAAS